MSRAKPFIGMKIKILIILYVLTIIPLLVFSAIVLDTMQNIKELGDGSMTLYNGMMMNIVIFLIMTLGVTIIASLILSDSITAPLKKLAETSQALSKGRFNRKLDVESNDEFGLLASSFNIMGSRLEESYTHLEEKVQERTSELEKSNDEQVGLYKELQQTQDQLIQSEKMAALGELVAGIAHEINNPISFIYGNIEPLNMSLQILQEFITTYESLASSIQQNDTERAEKYLVELKELSKKNNISFIFQDFKEILDDTGEGARRVREIVNDLKNFSRAGDARKKKFDVHDAIESSLKMINSQLKEKVDVIKNYEDIPKIDCYPAELNQVFLNILNNAAHSIEGKGTIWITTLNEKDHIEVLITDSGKGIPKSDLKRIFDPFFTTKPLGQGTGLGLSISYKIIEKHGGSIWVKSREGAGAEFTIIFPKEPQKSNSVNLKLSLKNGNQKIKLKLNRGESA